MKIPSKHNAEQDVATYVTAITEQYTDGLFSFHEYLDAIHDVTGNRIEWELEKAQTCISFFTVA